MIQAIRTWIIVLNDILLNCLSRSLYVIGIIGELLEEGDHFKEEFEIKSIGKSSKTILHRKSSRKNCFIQSKLQLVG